MITHRMTQAACRTTFLVSVCLSLALLGGGCFSKTAVPSGQTAPSGSSAGSGAASAKKQTPAGTRPYTVLGKTYQPLLDADGYMEEGVASWYGKDFHGKTTANGETYDMNAMTAAHKLLPFGTQLRVINLGNDRAITVRVNDRGPFVGNRILDLSWKGAEELGMLATGTAKVRIESIGAIPNQKGKDLVGTFYVQVGSFSVKDNAHNLAKKIQKTGKTSRVVAVPEIGFYRVQVGPYNSLVTAENAAASLEGTYPGNFVLAE
jgi:rare lipoprotein A